MRVSVVSLIYFSICYNNVPQDYLLGPQLFLIYVGIILKHSFVNKAVAVNDKGYLSCKKETTVMNRIHVTMSIENVDGTLEASN